MNPQLSDHPTWFEPTDKLRALDGKPIRIKEPDSEWDAKLVAEKDPDLQSANAGKFSVKAQWTSLKRTNDGNKIPTGQSYSGHKFLNKDAVDSLHENPDDPFGGLNLHLTKILAIAPP